jgi:hypothetical protein
MLTIRMVKGFGKALGEYALLLRIELTEDETVCQIVFATHEVHVRGRHLRQVYVAVSLARLRGFDPLGKFFVAQVLDSSRVHLPKRPKKACSADLPGSALGFSRYNRRPKDVSALQNPEEKRQGSPLLEHRREQARRG